MLRRREDGQQIENYIQGLLSGDNLLDDHNTKHSGMFGRRSPNYKLLAIVYLHSINRMMSLDGVLHPVLRYPNDPASPYPKTHIPSR